METMESRFTDLIIDVERINVQNSSPLDLGNAVARLHSMMQDFADDFSGIMAERPQFADHSNDVAFTLANNAKRRIEQAAAAALADPEKMDRFVPVWCAIEELSDRIEEVERKKKNR